jgi:hypothetical protein
MFCRIFIDSPKWDPIPMAEGQTWLDGAAGRVQFYEMIEDFRQHPLMTMTGSRPNRVSYVG